MTNWKINPPNARATANIVARIRNRSGGNDWNTAGIEDALLKAADMADEPDLVIAMIRAACEPVNRTPAIVLHPGPHWKQADSPVKYPQVSSADRCAECQQGPGPSHPKDHEWVKPTSYVPPNQETRAELIARVKAERAAGRAQLCRHGATVCKLCDEDKPDPVGLPDLEPTRDGEPVPVAP